MNRRTWLAASVAPLWTPAGLLLLCAWDLRADPILAGTDPLRITGMVALVGLLLGFAAMLVVGLPLHALLRTRRITEGVAYALAAALVGVVLRCLGIAASALPLASRKGANLASAGLALLGAAVGRPDLLLWAGLLGALVGVTFWWIARPDRPPAPG